MRKEGGRERLRQREKRGGEGKGREGDKPKEGGQEREEPRAPS